MIGQISFPQFSATLYEILFYASTISIVGKSLHLNWISTLLNQMQICKWGEFESWYFSHQNNIVIGSVQNMHNAMKKNCLSTNKTPFLSN